MPNPQPHPSRATALFLLALDSGALGRAVPYTAFEGRSPFEGSQMEAIERLRARGASEKEIFARFPHPLPAPVAVGETPSQWSGLLYSVLVKLGVDSEQQGDVVETIEGKMAGEEREHDKRAVGEGVEEMVDDTQAGMRARSHGMTGDVGGMVDVNGSLDERAVGMTEKDREMAGGDEHATHERAVDMVENMHDVATLEHAASTATEKRWTDDDNEHAQDKEYQTAGNAQKDWKTSTEISVRADMTIEKRRIDLDMENGGLEVHGQMGGLKGLCWRQLCEQHKADIVKQSISETREATQEPERIQHIMLRF
ncbi:hypothetical protein MMC26_005826 [Xylographa opegraphella]|nr:hypothetical protein [Xylographa opegraphella]